jgi:hypothetical protein
LNKTTELNKAAELEKARAEEAKCSDEISAFVMSQEFVKDQLKAPSTAKFPWMSNSQVSVKYLGDCVYEISAYVDSQNSFGAMLRSRYYAKLQNRRGTDSWSALAIRIE